MYGCMVAQAQKELFMTATTREPPLAAKQAAEKWLGLLR